MKEFDFICNGFVKLHVDDNPKAGVIMKILKMTLKHRAGNAMPEPDIDEYVVGLATSLTEEFRNKPMEVRDLPWDKYAQLCEILGDEFPMERFLYPTAKLIFGKKLEKTDSISLTESTSSAPSSG